MEYKAPLNPEWTAWREYSTDIGNFGQCVSILLAVGLKPGLLLDRTRRVATYNSATLSLDNVRELGYFLEIEVEANDTSDQTALNVIHHIRERLGLNGKPEERPYGEIMLSRLASDDLLQSRHENLVKNLLLELDD